MEIIKTTHVRSFKKLKLSYLLKDDPPVISYYVVLLNTAITSRKIKAGNSQDSFQAMD